MVTIRNKADVVISTIIGRFLRKKKICKQFFLTFPIMSLFNVYLKTTRKDSSPCLPKEKRWADLTPFMSLLVLIRCVISTAHGTFCSGWKRGLFN